MCQINFSTFLRLSGEKELVELCDQVQEIAPIDEPFAARLISLVRMHMATGSHPDAVQTWIDTHRFADVDAVIDERIERLMHRSAQTLHLNESACRISWKQIPSQLARENTRFHNLRSSEAPASSTVESLLLHLTEQGIIRRVRRLDRPQKPLEQYVHQSQYKYYLTDTGLYRRLAGFDGQSVNRESPALSRFRGILSESYALEALSRLSDAGPWYWKSGNRAEVDFIIRISGIVFPVEVKTARNVKSHSLALYRHLHAPETAIRLSLLNLKRDDDLINIPFYLIDRIGALLSPMLRKETP